MIDRLFRDRRTGGTTIAQVPNVQLIVFLVAVVVRWILHPSGTVGTVEDLHGGAPVPGALWVTRDP
jgi:hypothetical protein